MRTTIFGGHGKIALLLAPRLIEAGHEVQSVIRNPDHAEEVEQTGATAVVQSVEESDADALFSLLAGQDAVIWSAGAGGGDPQRTYAVDRDAAIRSIDAAQRAGVERYVMVSFSGAFTKDLVAEDDAFFPYMDAKIAADEHLRQSDLDWTILAPGTLTTAASGGAVNPQASFGKGDESPRDLVAEIAVAVLDSPAAIERTLVFGAGEVPIEDWLAA